MTTQQVLEYIIDHSGRCWEEDEGGWIKRDGPKCDDCPFRSIDCARYTDRHKVIKATAELVKLLDNRKSAE